MKPAFSVIFFTVSSGAGFGLMSLLILVAIVHPGSGLDNDRVLYAGILSLILITVGLLSSTLHLANPKNAWRSFSRFKTSWLSREGVFAVLFYPIALGYLALTYYDAGIVLRTSCGIVTLLLAWIVLYCTGMIYASLKPIPQWHTPIVPLAYFVLGHFSGAILLLVFIKNEGSARHFFEYIALAWLIAGAVVKASYYKYLDDAGRASTIQSAIGISRARVKLLDSGHTHKTFLTTEFCFSIARRHAVVLKIGVFVFAFLLPCIILMLGPTTFPWSIYMACSVALGLIAERWLFFAEARHVVRLYHGL